MASMISSTAILFLAFNLLFFAFATANNYGYETPPSPKPKHSPRPPAISPPPPPKQKPTSPPTPKAYSSPPPPSPKPKSPPSPEKYPPPPPPPLSPKPTPPPSPYFQSPPPPPPSPKPTPSPHPYPQPAPYHPPPSSLKGTCPMDTLKLGVCANLLGGLVGVVIGSPPTTPCCSLLDGLIDLEAAVCLCTAIKANILGISLNVPVSLSVILNNCGKAAPTGFECAL